MEPNSVSLNFKSSQPFPGSYNSLQLKFSYNCKRYVYEIVAYLAASSRLVISRTTRGDGVITSPTVFPWVLFNSFWISLKACTWMKQADVIERNQIKKHKKWSPICKEQWNSGNKEKIQKRHLQLEIHSTPLPRFICTWALSSLNFGIGDFAYFPCPPGFREKTTFWWPFSCMRIAQKVKDFTNQAPLGHWGTSLHIPVVFYPKTIWQVSLTHVNQTFSSITECILLILSSFDTDPSTRRIYC